MLAREDRNLDQKDTLREFKIESLMMFVAGALFLISILQIFWVPAPNGWYWRFYLWIIPFAMSSVRRRTMTVMGEIKKSRVK